MEHRVKLVFTALPNGIGPSVIKSTETVVKLSVAISPKVILTNTTNEPVDPEVGLTILLEEVDDLLNWPTLINKAVFTVQPNGSTPIAAKKVSQHADHVLWGKLFSPKLTVRSFDEGAAAKNLDIPVVTYPLTHILSYVTEIFQKTGREYTNDMPDGNYYTSNPLFTDISNYRVKWPEPGQRASASLDQIIIPSETDKIVKAWLDEFKLIPFNKDKDNVFNSSTIHFAQLGNFHGLYDEPRTDFLPVKEPDFEFHDIISVLFQYPKLLRMLGLVIDLEIPVNSLQGINPLNISVSPGLTLNPARTITCPVTVCEKTGTGFYAMPENGSFLNMGHVKIADKTEFTVFQLDTDGIALKLISHMDGLQTKRGNDLLNVSRSPMPMEDLYIAFTKNELVARREGLPSIRSAGISIAKNDMASYLNKCFIKMKDLKKQEDENNVPILSADDINIGYRMCVSKKGENKWHSLHFTANKYSFHVLNKPDESIDIGLDEGFIQLSTTEDKTIAGRHMKLSEVIARWEGWSLAVPTPGLSLNEPRLKDDPANPTNKPVSEDDKAKYTTPIDAKFTLNVFPALPGKNTVITKGSIADYKLPRLRFGQAYDFKLRMVDMAGNSVPHDSQPEKPGEAVESEIYRRYEPVDAPFLIPANNFKDNQPPKSEINFRDGESSEVMVIRSNNDVSVTQYEENTANQYEGQPGEYKDTCTRFVKPPRTTVGMAINHGMFDTGIGFNRKPEEINKIYETIVSKDAEGDVSGPTAKQFDQSLVATVLDDDPTSKDPSPLNVEYLVDPMAAGVSFFLSAIDPFYANKKITPEQQKYIDKVFSKRYSFYFDEVKDEQQANQPFDFMHPKTFRIVLQELALPIQENEIEKFIEWNGIERKLIVHLPKGMMLKLNYACFWKPTDIEDLSGMFQILNKSLGPNQPPIDADVLKRIKNGQHWMFSPWRTLTFVHAVQQPVPKDREGKKLPLITKALSSRNPGELTASLNIGLLVHNTSTGLIDIQAEWDDQVDDIKTDPGPKVKSNVASVYHFATNYQESKYIFANNTPFAAVPHHFNDTKHRWVKYKAIASTRYKEYFFHLISEFDKNNEEDIKNEVKNPRKKLNITTESDPVLVNVLSSVRPAAPQIAYVIPTFEWKEVTIDSSTTKIRLSGLRIYFKRPWFSSGVGEKLAVVLNRTKHDSTGKMDKFCTTWGSDPSKKLESLPPDFGIFPLKEWFIGVEKDDLKGENYNLHSESGLSIDELGDATVDIVAYDVKEEDNYDPIRKLYYVDIMLGLDKASNAYYPFIRLALAAYQQHSVRERNKNGEIIKDYCLSKIVQADYIQIPPLRMTSLQVNTDTDELIVTIGGSLHDLPVEATYIPEIEFIVEAIEFTNKIDDAVLTVKPEEFANHPHKITQGELKKNTFNYSHHFSLKTKPIIKKPYRVKIFEYETISVGVSDRRMVFADVYDVPGTTKQSKVTVHCAGITKTTTKCKHMTSNLGGFCFQHIKQLPK